jgi:hypothetical protein
MTGRVRGVDVWMKLYGQWDSCKGCMFVDGKDDGRSRAVGSLMSQGHVGAWAAGESATHGFWMPVEWVCMAWCEQVSTLERRGRSVRGRARGFARK